MRLFTKLRAEQIETIAYPLPVVPPTDVLPTAFPAKPDPITGAKVVPAPVKSAPDAPKVVITTIHRESYESPKADLLLSPKVAERKDPEGPIVGDWYVTDYDIMTDKIIRKVYDNDTFTQYFKASIGG